jgi:hypothetical protein
MDKETREDLGWLLIKHWEKGVSLSIPHLREPILSKQLHRYCPICRGDTMVEINPGHFRCSNDHKWYARQQSYRVKQFLDHPDFE